METAIPFTQRRDVIAAPPSRKQTVLAYDMGPQKLPVWSSEFVGGTFESSFRQIRSGEFVGRALRVSSGKLVGSPGDL